MSHQKLFSLLVFIIALVGIFSSRKLPVFTTTGNIAEGFAPIVYSIGLLFFALIYFLGDKSKEKINVRAFTQGEKGKAFVFFLLNILFLLLIYLFGPLISMLGFSILACNVLNRQTRWNRILFSFGFVIVVYLIFVVVMKMPFDRGFFFEMLR